MGAELGGLCDAASIGRDGEGDKGPPLPVKPSETPLVDELVSLTVVLSLITAVVLLETGKGAPLPVALPLFPLVAELVSVIAEV